MSNPKSPHVPKAPVELEPIGTPPRNAPARVRYWWKKTIQDWPQLSRRDRQALLDYCFALVEQEELRIAVEKTGRFVEDKRNGCMTESVEYKSLVRVDKRLQSLRRDFAAFAGYRERAGSVRKKKVEQQQNEFGGI